jgi:uncharacterized membrane protein YhaH (DUF805 family)
MNPFVLLFGFSGRINRAKFWLAALIYVVFFGAVIGITRAVSSSLNAMLAAALIAYIPLIVSGIAVGIRRLHDRNKSGWWLLVFYVGPLLLNLVSGYALDEAGIAHQAALFLSFAINIWALVELGCLRGTIGQNKYGPDPLAPEVLTPPVRTHA